MQLRGEAKLRPHHGDGNMLTVCAGHAPEGLGPVAGGVGMAVQVHNTEPILRLEAGRVIQYKQKASVERNCSRAVVTKNDSCVEASSLPASVAPGNDRRPPPAQSAG